MQPMNRRSFLATSAGAVSAAGATLWLPRRARGEVAGALRRAVVLYLPGGVRWDTTFHAAASPIDNPYGRLPLGLVPAAQRGHAGTPGRPWPVSRLFHLRPEVSLGAADPERLRSDDAADLCFAQPRLAGWPGRPALPSFISMAGQVAVLACDANPGGPAVLAHAAAQRRLFTGAPAGELGLATLFTAALGGRTRLPAVALDAPEFAAGAHDGARPLVWSTAAGLPLRARRRRGLAGGAALGLAGEAPGLEGEASGLEGEASGLEGDALALESAPLDTTYGATVEGAPVSNGMLRQLFGAAAGELERDDPLRAALRAGGLRGNAFGWQGARAVRLLQHGAPLLCLSVGDFDTHVGERAAAAVQGAQLARLFTSLSFALHRIADPDTGAPLWDSTVVVAVSEFGRRGPNLLADGFNPSGGSDHDRAQFFPLMGGPVQRPGQVIDDDGRPFEQGRLWTSLLAGFGLHSDALPRRAAPPVPGLLPDEA